MRRPILKKGHHHEDEKDTGAGWPLEFLGLGVRRRISLLLIQTNPFQTGLIMRGLGRRFEPPFASRDRRHARAGKG